MLPFSRFEAKTILKLSGPIMLAQLTQTMMFVVDTIMAGRVSALDMAAIAVASAIWLPIILTLQGLLLALTPIISQLYGAKNHKAIPHNALQGFYLAMVLATVIVIAMQFIHLPLQYLSMEENLREKAVDYLVYVSYGVYPAAGYMIFRNLFEGIGNTKATMWIAFVGILVNIPANYVFIYGKLGMPALGGAGCGVATSLVFLAMFIAITIYAFRSRSTALYMKKPDSLRPNRKDLWHIIAIGTPIAFSLFFEVTLFSSIPLMIVHLGPIVVAGHQIANNYSALVFMLPMSMGMATTIRVGHLVGSNDVQELKKAVSTAVQLAMMMAVGIALVTYFGRFLVASLYSTDPAVLAVATSILVLACFYQISDAIQVVSACALRGLKHTKPIFFITFIAYWPIGFGLGTVLGLTDWILPKMGAHGFWIGIIVGLSCAAVMLALILKNQIRRLEDGKFYSSNNQQPFTKALSLVAVVFVFTGCSDPALSLMDDYTSRLSRTLALEIQDPAPLDLQPLPSITTTRADITENSITLVELVATRACGLDLLLGERNSSLGKVMTPSQRLKYELAFLKQVQPCLTHPDIAPDLQQKLAAIASDKAALIDKHWQNFLQQDETLRQQLHPYRSLSEPNSVAGVAETIQALHSLLALQQSIAQQNWQQASSINPEQALEALYKANTLSQLQQSLRFSQNWLQSLNQQLDRVDLTAQCPAGKSSDKAEILNTILLQYFIGKVQLYLAQVDGTYQQLYPLLQQLYRDTSLAPSIQQRMQVPNTELKAELRRHVIWWKAVQQHCSIP